ERRLLLFRHLMQWQNRTLTDTQVFSIAIDKAPAHARNNRDPRETAWTYAIQRLDRLAKEKDDKVMVFPDEGHAPLIKRLIRRMRRFHQIPGHFGQQILSIPTERIIEDPNDR